MMPYDQGVVRARFPILSICRSLLEVLEPEQLLVTASPQTLQQLRNLNEAVAQYNQVPVSRGSFDDSNVSVQSCGRPVILISSHQNA